MECVTPVVHIVGMELLLNIFAGGAAVVFAVVGIYSVAAIWSDELP